uniref:Uncharacterized protein n=1 Tax=Anguilla anguilla TaxID=7936 RepID=A0A0E9VDD5_ANGAN
MAGLSSLTTHPSHSAVLRHTCLSTVTPFANSPE